MSDPTTQSTVTYDLATAQQLEMNADGAIASLREFIIDSPSMYEIAGEELRNVKANQKTVEATRVSITKPLNDALRAANAVFAKPAAKWMQAEITIKDAMTTYKDQQDALAREAQAVADKATKLQRLTLMAESAKAYEEAQKAASAGDMEAAEAATEAAEAASLMSEVLTHTPTVVAAPKVAGISTRTTYTAAITDLKALVTAVAEGKAPLECLVADTSFLGAQARAYKKVGLLFPGVQVNASSSIAARAA